MRGGFSILVGAALLVSSLVVPALAQFNDVGGLADVQESGLPISGGTMSGNIDMLANYIYSSTGVLELGGNCTSSHSLGTGDTCVDQIEANGLSYFDAGLIAASGGYLRADDLVGVIVGSGNDARFTYNTNQTPDSAAIQVSADSNAILFYETADSATDFTPCGGVACTDPHVIVMAATGVNNSIELSHDQTDAVVTAGAGDLKMLSSEGNGQATFIRTNSEALTFAADPGDASKTTTGLIPAGSILVGLTTRVTTGGTNCADMDVGISGDDVDNFADAVPVTLNATTDNSDWTAVVAFPLTAATDVIVTGTNGAGGAANCFALVVNVTAHFINVLAPTS